MRFSWGPGSVSNQNLLQTLDSELHHGIALLAAVTPKNQAGAEVTCDTRGSLSFGGQRVMNLLLVGGANNDDTFFGLPRDGLLGTRWGGGQLLLSKEVTVYIRVGGIRC